LGLPDEPGGGSGPEAETDLDPRKGAPTLADDRQRPGDASPVALAALPADLALHLDEVERSILERALERHRYNRTAAGASLGLSLRQMRYRMARLGVGGGWTDPAAERSEGD
jgi:two-component system response regulator PilR (NtrC family)